MATTYVPLEPTLTQAIGGTLSFDAASSSIGSATSTIFILLVSASLLAGLMRFGYAGLLYVKATSSNQTTEAKEVLKNAAYGIIGVLGMYLLLNQINPDMLRGDIGFVKVGGNTVSQSTTTAAAPTNPTIDTSVNPDEAEARKKLVNVGVNKPAPATQIAGLPDKTINMVNSLKVSCGSGCDVTITGGTEPGHQTHARGLDVIDLRCASGGTGCGTDSLSTYIRNNGGTPSTNSNCYEQYYRAGFYFCNEKPGTKGTWAPHWHVRAGNTSGGPIR